MRHRNRDPANAPNRYKVKSLRSDGLQEGLKMGLNILLADSLDL